MYPYIWQGYIGISGVAATGVVTPPSNEECYLPTHLNFNASAWLKTNRPDTCAITQESERFANISSRCQPGSAVGHLRIFQSYSQPQLTENQDVQLDCPGCIPNPEYAVVQANSVTNSHAPTIAPRIGATTGIHASLQRDDPLCGIGRI